MLVGRVSERQQIARHLANARIGHGGVLVVVGEPGIGKTTLLADARAHLADMRVVQLHGVESEREVAFAGLQQLCDPFLEHVDALPSPQRHALTVALALEDGPPPERFALGAAVLGLLTQVAEARPLAVLVDDLHALDVSSGQALAFAGRRLSSDAVGVVATARLDEPFPGADLPRLPLGPLSVEETRVLLGRSSGRPWADEQLDRWHRATAGNPLAVLELSARGPDLVAAPPDAPVALTGDLVASFARRMSELSAPCRDVLLLAATDSHDLAALHRACERAGPSLRALEEAEQAGLVRLDSTAVEFTHPLVRAAAYGTADPRARREAHRLLAGVLDDAERDRRAWHAAEASVGPDDAVATALADAATASTRRGANAVASAQFERAARLTPGRAARCERLRLAGEQAWLAGASTRAHELLEQAMACASDVTERSLVQGRLGAVAARCGSLVRARDLLLAAAEEAEPHDREAAALLLVDAAESCLYLYDAAGALVVAERLLALIDEGLSPPTRRQCSVAAGIAHVLAGRADRGTRLIRDTLADRTDPGAGEDLWRRFWTLVGPLFLREAGPAREAMDEAAGSARELSPLGVRPLLLALIAKDDMTTLRWDAAESGYAEAVQLATETDHPVDEALAHGGLAWLLARRGRAEECRAEAAAALELARRHSVRIAEVWGGHALAELALALGHPGPAATGYERLERLLTDLGVTDADVWPGPDLAECYRQTGRGEQATATARAYLTRATAKGQPWALARAHRAMGLVGDRSAARDHFAEALANHARAPDPFETARTQLALGSRLRRDRRRADAREPLRAAVAAFDRLRAAPWAERAAAELAATGEHPQRRGEAPHLTPQERQISRMLTEGRTTRETAAALFLSPKTVEYHLRSVYNKLGIRSREELARVLAGDG
ncbi:MAG TPA: AAA family ATPase [Segeticoccus sp.]|nr:AAA family ATPase [Segeticoccus sp.]